MEDNIIKTEPPKPVEVENVPLNPEEVDTENPLLTFSKFLKGE